MTTVEQEIFSTPSILRRTLSRLAEGQPELVSLLPGPTAFLGCGSSYCVGLAGAALQEAARAIAAQATMASEYRARPGWSHLAISRTGQTTELVEAMGRARAAGAPVALLCGAADSPAAALADAVLQLEFAAEQSVIQTRFISAATLALRLLIGGASAILALADLPERLEVSLERFDPEQLSRFGQIVFLGRDWRYGMALSAALNLQETALLPPNGFQTLEYRHGPMACADADTLVWCFDPPGDRESTAVLEDVRRTGATVYCIDEDPLIGLAQAQLVAVRRAQARGIDPDAPRNLQRAIVLPPVRA